MILYHMEHFLMVLATAVAFIWGLEFTMHPGEIFGKVGDWAHKHLPEWLHKPLLSCQYCMSSFHGSWIFFVFIGVPFFSPTPWWLWVMFCFCCTGVSRIVSK